MRLVDITNFKVKDKIYSIIEQPMPIYHSTEELYNNVVNPVVIHSFPQFLQFIQDNKIDMRGSGIQRDLLYKDVVKYNIWLATGETHVPSHEDVSCNIHYELLPNGEMIETDNCYVRLYYFLPLGGRIALFTSSGVNFVHMRRWELTAAERSQFRNERDYRAKPDENQYRIMMETYFNRNRSDVNMFKFVTAFFIPSSPYFMNLDKASVVAFGTKIKKEYREKIITSNLFKVTAMQVIKIFVPELKSKIKEDFPPEKMVEMLQEMFKTAKDGKNVSAMMSVYSKIEESGYSENEVVTERGAQLPQLPPLSTITTPALPPNKEATEILPELQIPDMFKGKTEEEIRQELDYPAGFIMQELTEEPETEGESK